MVFLKKSLILLACVAALGTVTNPVLAHGDMKHGHGVAVKEQKDWGIAGEASAAQRTVEVGMGDDMRFQPGTMEVKQGETIRFKVKNTGKLLHEFVIGTKAENAKHAELMLKFPGMEHDEPYMAHVDPGKTGEIVWTFNRAGEFEFACLIAGHFQAGMAGKIIVAANDLADGEVRKINMPTGKITVKHGHIKSVEMPPMTMVFGVADKNILNGLKEGDKIKFDVKQDGASYIVTQIQKAQ